MQRLLRIVLFITFMLLIILWFSTIFNTCNKEGDLPADTESVASESDTSNVFQDLDDELFEDNQDLFSEGDDSDASQALSNETPTNTAEDVLGTDDSESYTDYTGSVQSTDEGVSTAPQASGGSGAYLVVAGSFLIKANAEAMQKKLQNMGYSAEVRNFNYSQYHSVIAGRYDVKSSADRVVANLKSKGISCYVHKRQP
jgi:cell division protein FtsN